MSNLKYRLLAIGALIVVSIWALFPRTVIERVKRNGVFVTDTVRRVPLKRGLDLQGGMHLTLEVDESKGAVADKSEALDRAIKVVRNRIDELGVSEPVVQKAGTDRVIVELPGVDDPARAQGVVQKAAFLEFQITDKTNALERSISKIDQIASTMVAVLPVAGDTAQKTTVEQKGINSLLKAAPDSAAKKDSAAAGAKGDTSKAAKDSTNPLNKPTSGPFSKAIQPAGAPGQYVLSEADYQHLQPLLDSAQIQGAMPPGKILRWGADTLVVNGQVGSPGTELEFAL